MEKGKEKKILSLGQDNTEVRVRKISSGCVIGDVDEVEVLNVPNVPRGGRYFQVGNGLMMTWIRSKEGWPRVDIAMKKILKI